MHEHIHGASALARRTDRHRVARQGDGRTVQVPEIEIADEKRSSGAATLAKAIIGVDQAAAGRRARRARRQALPINGQRVGKFRGIFGRRQQPRLRGQLRIGQASAKQNQTYPWRTRAQPSGRAHGSWGTLVVTDRFHDHH
jgi:hypothetical protein